ncbi:MAG: AI-2E family transporter [Microscillaceae bacterium]|jgi:predicted PurR-regulated permease PerM|nr:AI-2E family transporter [Microscillaceae bacterium]
MINRTLVNLGLFVIAMLIAMWFFSHILVYLLISIIISAILRPMTDYVDSVEVFGINIPRLGAVFLSFLVLAVIPVLFVLLFVPLILEQISVLQNLDYQQIIGSAKPSLDSLESFVIDNFQPSQKRGFLLMYLNTSFASLLAGLQIGEVLNYFLSFTGSVLIYMVSVGFITFILLYEKGLARRILLSNIPNQYFEVVITTVYKIERLLSNYLLGLLMQVVIMFSVIALGLSIVGVKYALTIAIFMAIINLIPYLGPAIGFLFGVFVVVSTDAGATNVNHWLFDMLRIAPVFAIAVALDNLLVQPIIFSKSVKAHPLEIFIAIFAGATLAGPLGMLVAIPTYTILRVSYRELTTGYKQYHIFKIHKNHREPLKHW